MLEPATATAPPQRDEMLAELYGDLRRAAARMLAREAPTLTIQPTDLVNEAALRILHMDRMSWADRRHFFATGARILRQAMLDAIRRRRAGKRLRPEEVPPELLIACGEAAPVEVEALDCALTRLETASPDLARIVELRFFVGLSVSEIALLTEQSDRTVKRRWQTARLWLADELGRAE